MSVRTLTRSQALQEIADLVAESGTTEDDLRARGERWELRSHDRGLLQQIDGLRWLLTHMPTVAAKRPRTDEQGPSGTSGHRHDGEAYKATEGDE